MSSASLLHFDILTWLPNRHLNGKHSKYKLEGVQCTCPLEEALEVEIHLTLRLLSWSMTIGHLLALIRFLCCLLLDFYWWISIVGFLCCLLLLHCKWLASSWWQQVLINGWWLPSIQFFIPAKVNCSALPAVWTISGQSVSGPETPDQGASVSDYRFLEGDTLVVEEEEDMAKVASRSSSCSTVTLILTLVTMLLLNSATITSTNLERSRTGFESWPLLFNSRKTSESVKKLETPFVNFASARQSSSLAQRNGSDITGEKVTFKVRFYVIQLYTTSHKTCQLSGIKISRRFPILRKGSQIKK